VSAPLGVGEAVREPPFGHGGVQRRTVTMLVCGFAAVLLFSLVGLAPTPYAVISPGPVYDTLSTVGGRPLIRIEGRPTYETEGSLELPTV
jgi:PDZ domain-containing protein